MTQALGLMQGRLGSPPDCSAHLSHAQLGDGVQEVVPCFQAVDLFWQRQGAQG